MITRNAEPIGHHPVYKPIDINGPKPATAPVAGRLKTFLETYEEGQRLKEGERIWRLIRQSAGDPIVEAPKPEPAPEIDHSFCC
jgi:hypothetical protein